MKSKSKTNQTHPRAIKAMGRPGLLVILLSALAIFGFLSSPLATPLLGKANGFHFEAQPIMANEQAQTTPAYIAPVPIPGATAPLRVHPANPRYFMDGNGRAVFLAGSHTWDNRQDQGASKFDWPGYLDDLDAWNHNFIRFWVWEQGKNLTTWPDPVNPGTTLVPGIWLRTGPGVAADGRPKYDLTKYNPRHFDRLRSRVLDAGDRGIYVSIMLFDGWSVAQKAGGSNPWPYHPFHSANNINSVNGDPNGDQAGYETQNLSIPEITALQEAYVAHVIDTVNDLDNVLYEISNESSGDVAGTLEWSNHFIDFIHAYEATKPKQHPVWFTVPYPGGNNQDLLASNAEAISPNSDVSNDGAKVVIPDTDHYFGIGGDADWAWKKFTQGYGGAAYMDSWDNRFLDASSFGHPLQNLRDNLGYIVTYANRMNLAEMEPHGELCSTGYCLANPSASGAEYLVYLPSGSTATQLMENLGIESEDHRRISSIYLPTDSSVNVDLSATGGNLLVEWLNPATGRIIKGGKVAGGANRTFTAPFTGSAVLYLSQRIVPVDP